MNEPKENREYRIRRQRETHHRYATYYLLTADGRDIFSTGLDCAHNRRVLKECGYIRVATV